MDYKNAYALLVKIISNVIDEIGKSHVISQEIENALGVLKEGLEKAEEMYICSHDSEPTVFGKSEANRS